MTFYHRLLREMRESILRDEFTSYYEKKRFELVRADEENPGHPPKKAKTAQPASTGRGARPQCRVSPLRALLADRVGGDGSELGCGGGCGELPLPGHAAAVHGVAECSADGAERGDGGVVPGAGFLGRPDR